MLMQTWQTLCFHHSWQAPRGWGAPVEVISRLSALRIAAMTCHQCSVLLGSPTVTYAAVKCGSNYDVFCNTLARTCRCPLGCRLQPLFK